MKTFIALLRGINVGGHKKVPMADLRQLLTDSGFFEVKTYIQSGNVVLKSAEKSVLEVENIIKELIHSNFGFEVSVLVRTPEQFQSIIDNCPFKNEKREASYFVLLHTIPNKELAESTSKEVYNNEEFFITKDCIYTFCTKGYSNAKCGTNLFERKLKVVATARNYRTMMKILALVK